MVSWLFQFEWCAKKGDGRDQPWWCDDKTTPPGTAYESRDGEAWPVRGPGLTGSTTFRGRPRPSKKHEGIDPYLQSTVDGLYEATILCPTCKTFSDTVYETYAPCLNERCRDFFKDARHDSHRQYCSSWCALRVHADRQVDSPVIQQDVPVKWSQSCDSFPSSLGSTCS